MTDKVYLSCAETAKLIRAALKKAFPGIKFSVKSKTYSGGASITVGWTDGPRTDDVNKVIKPFEGGGFDGMIDMAYNKDSWLLPDGTAAFASSKGTIESAGSMPGYDNAAPVPGARKVSFGADYVFTNKTYSLPTYTAAVAAVCADYGIPMPEVFPGAGIGPYVKHLAVPNAGGQDLETLVRRKLSAETW